MSLPRKMPWRVRGNFSQTPGGFKLLKMLVRLFVLVSFYHCGATADYSPIESNRQYPNRGWTCGRVRKVKIRRYENETRFLTIPDSKPSQKPLFPSCGEKLKKELSPFIHNGFRSFSRMFTKAISRFEPCIAHHFSIRYRPIPLASSRNAGRGRQGVFLFSAGQ